jgi:hypothetical protein
MRRYKVILILTMLPCSVPLVAQRDSSLTSEFARMSARERTRIAREEGALAGADTAFQAAMRAGEEHFRGARYREALERFQRARDLRPLNVHPKVKIQDLQALLARQVDGAGERSAEEQAPAPVQVPGHATTDPARETVPVGGVERGTGARMPDHPARATAPPPSPRQAAAAEPQLKATAPEGHTGDPPQSSTATPAVEAHRIFREGRAVVEERVVHEGGRQVVWRKVLHPWGEVVHFRDNEAIPERRWQERFAGVQSNASSITGNSSRDR